MKFLDIEEQKLRQEKLQQFIRQQGLDGLLVSSNANLYYVSGAVYAGYAYVPAEGNMLYLVRRPVGIEHPQVVYIRKPEQILDVLESVASQSPHDSLSSSTACLTIWQSVCRQPLMSTTFSTARRYCHKVARLRLLMKSNSSANRAFVIATAISVSIAFSKSV